MSSEASNFDIDDTSEESTDTLPFGQVDNFQTETIGVEEDESYYTEIGTLSGSTSSEDENGNISTFDFNRYPFTNEIVLQAQPQLNFNQLAGFHNTMQTLTNNG